MEAEGPQTILLADYQPPEYLIETVELDIALDPTRTRVAAKLSIVRNPALKTVGKVPLKLDGELMELESIALDGRQLKKPAYRVDDTSLTIPSPPQEPFTLETVTYVNPQANTALQGIYLSRGVYCSQCEAQGFRRITYFSDRPDVLARFTVRLEADVDAAPVLLANGNPVERGTLAKRKRHYAIWHDPHPKPSYLFAIVGGDLGSVASTFKTASGRDVDLRIYVEHGKEERAHWAMDSLKRSMRWDEKRFGCEYDLDVFNIVAVSDFNMGAMENKGLNIFNDRLVLASPETATDANYEAIESVVAHEYFHNWTGNRITCRDWFQLCLKEGLTVFRDQEFSAEERSRTVQRISDVRQLKSLQFPEDGGPLAHPVRPDSYIEINNFYTPTVYEKGAEIVRMIKTILGDKTFRAGMDLYFERHDGQAVTIEDFVACFADASGTDFSQFMRWYTQSGTPELVCDLTYDKRRKSAELTVHQTLKASPGKQKKQPQFIPLAMALLGENGKEMDVKVTEGREIRDGVLAVTERTNTFKFSGVTSRPVPSLLRGFSAPVNINISLSDGDLAFLMLHDSDLFNRWQAGNQYATRSILALIEAKRPKAVLGAKAAKFATAIRSALFDDRLDDAYKAELLKLPGIADVAREKSSKVDHSAIFTAHRSFSRAIAEALKDDLVEIYDRKSRSKTFSPDAKSAGRRALRNAALTLLTTCDGPEDYARVAAHYKRASNMTDSAHALVLISGVDAPERETVLRDFHDRWKGDHLVIDLWFAAQAQSPRSETLDEVKALTRDPLFRLTTPNKVRALIGTFAMANPVQFNRPDGAGYRFLADMVLEIDRLNPQVAARMLGAFRSFRSLEPKRRALAKAALHHVAGSSPLSRDCHEIVTRMLDD
ncbi:aminopeptidase N [Hyphomicrobium methylovorum]|uniref:aminopeptidase N n=1 Tax=Hyphomicrobium methylovorum TaxID=84 RepID=UPI0015E6D703|nr:aminopeptidase N [Hyphomicrobium methylovorum]MBA2124978.1 aminopeptidase N [Hyphomicrobium methylovorum]